jgi:hypothetical protein
VLGNVVIPRNAVDGFGDDFIIPADDARERKFALPDGFGR